MLDYYKGITLDYIIGEVLDTAIGYNDGIKIGLDEIFEVLFC